jgi:hypothetical protein
MCSREQAGYMSALDHAEKHLRRGMTMQRPNPRCCFLLRGLPLYDRSITRLYCAAGWMRGSGVRPCFR